jgi:transglutaminase-like putative cysteine protease
VSTSAAEALAARRGVCQDFAHVFLARVRALGIPARYVSGYLHSAQDPTIGGTEKGESHAWAEAWMGDWVPVDPTSGEIPGLRHVLVARGRDYRDVAPLRGIYSGGAAHALDVEVELTRTR